MISLLGIRVFSVTTLSDVFQIAQALLYCSTKGYTALPARSSSTTPRRASASASDDGEDVFVHASALPAGVDQPTPGSRVDFGLSTVSAENRPSQ